MLLKWCNSCGEGVVNFCRGHTSPCPMQEHIDRNNAQFEDFHEKQKDNSMLKGSGRHLEGSTSPLNEQGKGWVAYGYKMILKRV